MFFSIENEPMGSQHHSCSFSMFGCDLMLLHPVAQISTRRPIFLGNPGLRRSVLEECRDFHLMRVQLAFADTSGAAQRHPLLFASSERLRGPLGNQVTLNFSGHGKGHCYNLALDAVVQLPVPFDGIDADTLLHSQRKDFHALQACSGPGGTVR